MSQPPRQGPSTTSPAHQPMTPGGGRWALVGAAVSAGGLGSAAATAIGMGADPAICLLITAAATVITTLAAAMVTMYQARQHTVRHRIDHHGVNTIIDALATTITATHRAARSDAAPQDLAEAAACRAAATHLLTNPAGPTVLATTALNHHPPPRASAPGLETRDTATN